MIYCLHHNDGDGFAAAAAFYHKYGKNAEYKTVYYGGKLPDLVPGSEVYIFDFSYSKAIMLELKAKHAKVVCCDHHATAKADLAELEGEHENLYVHFDMEKSGCRLAWEYLFPGEEVPQFIKLVEDRDLWKFTLEDTKTFHAFLCTFPNEVQDWYASLYGSMINVDYWKNVLPQGQAILRYIDQTVLNTVKFIKTRKWIGHQGIPVANCTENISETNHQMLKAFPEAKFSSTYALTAKGEVSISFRSRSAEEFDVSTLAKQFGGGGHGAAAGAKVSLEQFAKLMNE